MADPNQDRPVHIDVDDARGGETPGIARYILAASLALVIVVFLAIYFLH